MGDLTVPQVKFPQVGEDSVFKSPSQQGEPQAVALHKNRLRKAIPQYGAKTKLSGQIESNPPVCPGVVGATH